MTTQPYELLARFNSDGTVTGVFTKTLTLLNGRAFENDPVPLADTTDPAFTQFAEAFSASVVAERNALLAKVSELQAKIPWNPRVIEASAFIARITADEMLRLATSNDAPVLQIVAMLNQWKANDWPIILDSPEIQQAIAYLQSIGFVTQERLAELLKDCTKEEAYVADGDA